MNCKKCNNIVPEGTTICPFCGEVLVGNEQVVDQAPINNDVNNTQNEVATDFNFVPVEPAAVNSVNEKVGEVNNEPALESTPLNEPTPEVTSEPNVDINSSAEVDNVQPTVTESTPAVEPVTESVPTMEPIPETMPSAVESVTEPVADAAPSIDASSTVVADSVMQPVDAQPMDVNITAPVSDSSVIEPAVSPKKNNGNKMFIIIVVILGLVLAALVVLVVLKKTNSSDDKKESNKQSEVKDDTQAKVEVKEKDAGEVEVEREPKVSNDRNQVQTDKNNGTNNNQGNNVEYQSNEQQQKNTQFKYFTYADVNFKIPDYIDVILDSNGDYYITDNQSYEARFNLIQGSVDEHIQNLNTFVNYLSQQGAAVTDSKVYTANDGSGTKILAVYYIYNNYPSADFFVNVNNQITALFEVSVFNQNILEYMLYDFDYISKNNEILGTFSSTGSKIKDRSTISKSTIKTPKLK